MGKEQVLGRTDQTEKEVMFMTERKVERKLEAGDMEEDVRGSRRDGVRKIKIVSLYLEQL